MLSLTNRSLGNFGKYQNKRDLFHKSPYFFLTEKTSFIPHIKRNKFNRL